MAIIKGTAKSETLTGTDQANQLLGLEGNDTLRALAGDDILNGGLGKDTLSGGSGNDTYVVDQLGDKVIERPGEGIDTVNASISFTLAFHIENLLLAGSGAINGKGNNLDNRLTGNSASNTLAGEAGNDIIDGGAGDDIIIGGKGADIVTGGRGADIFRFFGGDFAGRTAATADRIVDFSAGDHIDLSKVDALVAASEAIADGKQSFHFIGHNPFHIHSGRELRWDVSGGNTYIYGSTNGDAIADFAIRLDGVHSLTAADFII